MAASSDKVSEFIAFTGAGIDEAQSFLEMAGGELQQAVNLFMELQGGGGGGSPARRPAPSPSAPPLVAAGGDAAVAAEVAAAAAAAGIDSGPEQQGGGGGCGGDADEEAVRAPIAAFDDQIIDQGPGRQQLSAAIAADALNMDRRMSFDREADGAGGDWTCSNCGNANYASRTACHRCGTPKGGAAQKAINKLFAPPAYNQAAPFYQVIEKAKAESKWVLANIQGAEIFASHALNRDVWSDDVVQEMVGESFFFWQRDDQSVEGQQFCRNYRCADHIPHICVVDPRTGRSIKTWEAKKWKEACVVAEDLVAFLDRYGMPLASEKPPPPERPRVAAPAAPAAPPAAKEAAAQPQGRGLEASAAVSGAAPVSDAKPATVPFAGGGVRLGDSGGNASAGGAPASGDAAKAGAEAAATAGDAQAPPAVQAPPQSTVPVPEEPPADVEHLKVSFRTPSGQRVARRFLPSERVEHLLAVAASLVGQPVEEIDLSTQFPRRSLRDIEGGPEKCLKDAGVAGNMLLVETGKRRKEA